MSDGGLSDAVVTVEPCNERKKSVVAFQWNNTPVYLRISVMFGRRIEDCVCVADTINIKVAILVD